MSRKKGRILLVDDLERWRSTLRDLLVNAGFEADAVGTVKEALEKLDESFYHLAVLDIRMEDDDPTDVEGMNLLAALEQKGIGDSVIVMMLSAYGTREQMRESFRDYKVADFLIKEDFDGVKFVEQIRHIFAKAARINLDLVVHWQQDANAEQSVANLEIGGVHIQPDAQRLIASELDDLLCRLFYKDKSLMVRPLTPGYSGASVLWVQPFSPDAGGKQAVVVKFGDYSDIDVEYSNFTKYVDGFVGGGRSTSIRQGGLRRTQRLGGIVYSLLGRSGDKVESFGKLYERADPDHIRDVIDRLFHSTCGNWYANKGNTQPYNLTEDYTQLLHISREKLEKTLAEQAPSVAGTERLTFSSLGSDRAFINPVSAALTQKFVCSTYVCTTHGDFNANNILVDEAGHSWLIDFQRTGPGHILRDVAELDSVIRFELLAQDEATLSERLQMEEALCGVADFSDLDHLASRFQTQNQALLKSFATAVHLRMVARKLVESNTSADISEYYIALLYYAINTIKFPSLKAVQREHALLSASLLATRLGLG